MTTLVITPFKDLSVFEKENAKSLLNLSFNISDWSRNNYDDSKLPIIENFQIVSTIETYDTYGLKKRKFCAIYYSLKFNMLIIVFSGTVYFSEWIDDFDIRQTQPEFVSKELNIFLHLQHYNFYDYLRQNLLECIQKYIKDDIDILMKYL